MILDALTNISNSTEVLTGIAAGGTGYSDVLDLSTYRDIGTADMPFFVIFSTLPTSATGGATIQIALQTSPDNATWTTLESSGLVQLTSIVLAPPGDPFVFRGTVPATCQRYLRVAYTVSAVLTAGAAVASIGGVWPRNPSYPRNYVA